jgi:hypothetical protein
LDVPPSWFWRAGCADKVQEIVPWFTGMTNRSVEFRCMRRLQRILADGLAVLAIALIAPPALDQTARAQGSGVAEIAAYEGADRERRLIEGAKKEKELTFYSSIPTDDISALVAAFDKRYGVKVRVWRADSEGFLQRIMREAKARRFEVDIMAGSTSALEPLHRENLLQEVKSPNFADLIPEAIAPHRQWAAVYLNTIVQAYNTFLVQKENLPNSYRDLLKPEWKGKLGIESEDFDWFAQVVTYLGEARGVYCSATSLPRMASRCARGITFLPIWSPPARCRWRLRSTASWRSRRSAKARRSTGSCFRRRSLA